MATAYVEVPVSGERGRGLVTLVDPDDYLALGNRLVSVAGHGYAQIFAAGHRVDVLHRQVMGLRPGDGLLVDHINRNKLDNRKANLRLATRSMNSHNSPGRNGPFSRGTVRQRSGRWKCRVKHAGQYHDLGTYDTRREAWWVGEQWRRVNVPDYIPQES